MKKRISLYLFPIFICLNHRKGTEGLLLILQNAFCCV